MENRNDPLMFAAFVSKFFFLCYYFVSTINANDFSPTLLGSVNNSSNDVLLSFKDLIKSNTFDIAKSTAFNAFEEFKENHANVSESINERISNAEFPVSFYKEIREFVDSEIIVNSSSEESLLKTKAEKSQILLTKILSMILHERAISARNSLLHLLLFNPLLLSVVPPFSVYDLSNAAKADLFFNSRNESLEANVQLTTNKNNIRSVDRKFLLAAPISSTDIVQKSSLTAFKNGSAQDKGRKNIPTKDLQVNNSNIRSSNCDRSSSENLYQRLERIGALNQRFMANTPEEAGMRFREERGEEYIPRFWQFDDDNFQDSSDEILCDYKCQAIANKLHNALDENDHLTGIIKLNISFNDDGTNKNNGRSKSWTQCYLEKFIPLGECTKKGAEEIPEFSKLCSACSGVFVLSKRCFPRFINSIQCENVDSLCIFEKLSKSGHGQCKQKTFNLKILENNGSEDCGRWLTQNIEVPIACECYLRQSSWIKASNDAFAG